MKYIIGAGLLILFMSCKAQKKPDSPHFKIGKEGQVNYYWYFYASNTMYNDYACTDTAGNVKIVGDTMKVIKFLMYESIKLSDENVRLKDELNPKTQSKFIKQ